jgi:hypothetical protein
MQHIKHLIPKELVDGITGYYAHGSSLTLGFVEIKAGSILGDHLMCMSRSLISSKASWI